MLKIWGASAPPSTHLSTAFHRDAKLHVTWSLELTRHTQKPQKSSACVSGIQFFMDN